MTNAEQQAAAKKFAAEWKNKGYEKGQSQPFWLQLLQEVYGVKDPYQYIHFEDQVHIDKDSGFIDGYIDSTHTMIEQKGINKDLKKPIRQSDGTLLTPFQQAQRYSMELPYSKRPRWIVACNFAEFYVYDMERPNGEPEQILLENLPKEYYRLNFLIDAKDIRIKKEEEISAQAADKVATLYNAFYKNYKDPTHPHSLKSLNMLCVRLVFCAYAEDAGLFGPRKAFENYIRGFEPENCRTALKALFKVLDTKPEDRDPYDDKLNAFPYVNGGLFSDENIEIPQVTTEIRDNIVDEFCEFNWSQISPTVFGAMFESTLNPETRRSSGMHYTSIENIHKVIDSLFLDDLKQGMQALLEQYRSSANDGRKNNKARKALFDFQNKIASLKFLDPACGSGNFLTETYLCLRHLENEVLENLNGGQTVLGDVLPDNPIKVSISQFYGIEINDFAVSVAMSALWIAESQTLHETEILLHKTIDYLPLKTNSNIHEGNALRMDWDDVIPKERLDYIMGNPPFSGARMMGKTQKEDVNFIFDGWENAGNLDYVSCWYKKSADFMQNTHVRTALVSTNSVSQGDSVAILWKPLFQAGIHIDFAYRTFIWDSEAKIKAHVHCVIIGFSYALDDKPKIIFTSERRQEVSHINAYLLEADDVFVESRNKPLYDVPEIGIGNKPIDGGNYLFNLEEKNEFIKKEPQSEKYFRPWYGSFEFINRKPRYCLWLGDCQPNILHKMPECMKRIEAVRLLRLKSKSPGTIKLAEKTDTFSCGKYA